MAERGLSNAKSEHGNEAAVRAGGLETLTKAVRSAGNLPPVHLWNPPYGGEIDMRIAVDGTWFYQKTPIGRPLLVKLFSSVLRKDPDRFVLVTPVERVGIKVDDAPFVAVEAALEGHPDRAILLRTNVDDWVEVNADYPLRFVPGEAGGLRPYVRVRGDLWALIKRAVFYQLVDLGEVRELAGEAMFGVASLGSFFPMAPAAVIEGLA
jgi:hypothetical protein